MPLGRDTQNLPPFLTLCPVPLRVSLTEEISRVARDEITAPLLGRTRAPVPRELARVGLDLRKPRPELGGFIGFERAEGARE